MSKQITTRESATRAEVAEVLRNLRVQDLREAELTGLTPFQLYDAVGAATAEGEIVGLICVDGRPVVLGGVHNGLAWMVATDQVELIPNRVMYDFPRSVALRGVERFGRIFNYIPCGSFRTIRWLQHLGYTVEPAEDATILRRFWMDK